MPSTKSHYQTLEISETATHEEITRSYRRLALVHHHDKNDGDQESTARFQSVSLRLRPAELLTLITSAADLRCLQNPQGYQHARNI